MALAEVGVENSYEVYRAEYDKEFSACLGAVSIFSGVVEGLKLLRARGVHLAAVTAQPKRRADAMLPSEVRDLFEVFCCYNDTKGHKEVGIAKALSRLSVAADHAFYVGDQSTDLEAARKAGVRGIGVLWGFSSEAELLQWPHELLLTGQDEVGPDLLELLF